jgi:hypothetical protein
LRQEEKEKKDKNPQKKKDAPPSSPLEEKSLGVSVPTSKSGYACGRPYETVNRAGADDGAVNQRAPFIMPSRFWQGRTKVLITHGEQ